MAKRKVNTQPFWRFLFVVYLGMMLWLLFGSSNNRIEGVTYEEMLRRNMNLRPFYTIDNYMFIVLNRPESPHFVHSIVNLVGNLVMFIPAGYLLPRIFRRYQKFWRFLLCCVLSIALIEIIQLFTLLGSLDVDDFILNLLGMTVGFIVWKMGTVR